jgi:hypothetical protein
VKEVAASRRDLQYLADWMEITEAPPKWSIIKLSEENRAQRAERTRVCMLDFHGGGLRDTKHFNTATSLNNFLFKPGNNHDIVDIRLFVVEDLSRDVIEMLGSRFGIDPSVFRGQISDYIWYNTRDRWFEMPDLHIDARKRSYRNTHYTRAVYFPEKTSYDAAILQSGSSNVLRRIDRDHNEKPMLDAPGAFVAMARSRTALWIRPNSSTESGVLGVLLVDPTPTEGYPLWGGHRNFGPCPDFGSPVELPSLSRRSSIFENVIFWTSKLVKEDLNAVRDDPQSLGLPMYRMILAEWHILIKYITTRLGQIDWELEHKEWRLDPTGIDSALKKIHFWRRHLPSYVGMLEEAMNGLFSPDLIAQAAGPAPLWGNAALLQDFKTVMRQLDALQLRIERIVAVTTAIISIEENRRTLDQNELTIAQNTNLTRLTTLATVFIPMSFVAALFSMNSDVTSLSQTYWIFFVVCIPLTALALLLVDFLDTRKRIVSVWNSARGILS